MKKNFLEKKNKNIFNANRFDAGRRRGWKDKNRGSKFKFFKSNVRLRDGKRFKASKEFKVDRRQSGVAELRGPRRNYYPRVQKWNYKKRPYNNFKRYGKNNRFFKHRKAPPFKDLFLKNFTKMDYYFFKKEVGRDKKLVMSNYWQIFKSFVDPAFTFTFPQLDGKFFLGVVRSYMMSIRQFIKSFLKRLLLAYGRREVASNNVLKAFYGAYKVQILINHLANLYETPLRKPNYYFPGYRMFLRLSFFRHLAVFCMKIFILVNKTFSDQSSVIDSQDSFFKLWKKIYKNWLNIYYAKPSKRYKVYRANRFVFKTRKALFRAACWKDWSFWRKPYFFRIQRRGYKRTLLNYFFKYAWGNYKTLWPFSYRKRKNRFKYDIFGRRIYLLQKRLFRRKSRKYIRWFRTLVTGGYYFSSTYAQKTFYKGGYGRRAWMSRRRARHVFKMKFVFIRYFSKRFGLKNRTAFLRKAEHIARKGGNKWLRYYKEFESRLLRVLVLFGLSSNDDMAKSLITSNSVVVNRRILNDHNYKAIPRVKMGDLVSLANSAAPFFLKKKFKFFKKRLSFFDRGEEAKLIYGLFKKYFSEWMMPSVYSINGPIVRHGLSALMSGPIVTNSKAYFSINRFIPFFNRTLFKIFVQRFSKKLN